MIVGLSGGADSVALLALLREQGVECIAAHCNFGLRGDEADRDEAHARAIAARLGSDFVSVKFNTRAVMAEKGISAEMACRELRYDFFEKLRRERGARWIAVAHHLDDNIETLFLNLLRGSGIHGVRGMLPVSGHIIRPLLDLTREEILQYLDEQGFDYVTDSSNLSNEFRRNKLRNQVLPALYEAFPDAHRAIGRSLSHLRDNEALYNSLLPEELPSLPEIKRSAAPATLLHELLAPLGFTADQTEKMLTAESGSSFRSATHLAEIDRGELHVEPVDSNPPAPPRLKWTRISPSDFKPETDALYLDASALDGEPKWEVRPVRTGDRMKPFGMKGSRLISDIFASAKLPARKRRKAYVLTRNAQILWLIGLRTSALFPVTPSSTEILKIEIS